MLIMELGTYLHHNHNLLPWSLVIDCPTYRVEQGLPPHGDVEGDVEVGLVAARVELHIPSYILCVHRYILSRVTLDISQPVAHFLDLDRSNKVASVRYLAAEEHIILDDYLISTITMVGHQFPKTSEAFW